MFIKSLLKKSYEENKTNKIKCKSQRWAWPILSIEKECLLKRYYKETEKESHDRDGGAPQEKAEDLSRWMEYVESVSKLLYTKFLCEFFVI